MPEAWAQPRKPGCSHAGEIREWETPPAECPACAVNGDEWVHLRQCLVCGRVGCCDYSPNQHARQHFELTGHPVMRTIEPGESWRWCFEDGVEV
jgi:uncharacterized UBP type Zn finger protein